MVNDGLRKLITFAECAAIPIMLYSNLVEHIYLMR